jgi:hypothetical protein
MEQANYISALHQPKTMTPKQFLSQLWHLVSMLASFPQAPANIFMEDERKCIFLYVHPLSWVDHFKNARNLKKWTISSTTWSGKQLKKL